MSNWEDKWNDLVTESNSFRKDKDHKSQADKFEAGYQNNRVAKADDDFEFTAIGPLLARESNKLLNLVDEVRMESKKWYTDFINDEDTDWENATKIFYNELIRFARKLEDIADET